jgi:hypothetical protein
MESLRETGGLKIAATDAHDLDPVLFADILIIATSLRNPARNLIDASEMGRWKPF